MEALHQAHQTYQGVLMTPEFGERLYSGEIPGRWNHVFATWHSLERVPDELPPDHFDVIVIDEFHGAGSPTFTNVLERFAPMELLGLSSAPERTDGPSIHDAFFDGRIAAEMRLRDALASDLLCPLHYFGIADGTDLQPLGWKQGTYDAASLKAMLTGNDARARLVVNAIRDTVPDVKAMRAVGFCVSVAHAEFMAQFFRSAGFHAMALTSATPAAEREGALSSLRNGDLQVIFSVEMLSHGFSIPEVDTLLLLRPTSSGVRFLQQLGVGLARSPGKRVLTVLDFIGHHRKEFRLDIQFRAMTHLTGKRLLDHVERDFPRLPSGCMISLDEKARILVIENLREQMRSTVTDTAREIAQYGELGLRPYLQQSGRELTDLYRGDGTWTGFLRRAGVLEGEAPEGETALLKRVRSFLHVDDPERVQAYTRMLEDDAPLYNDLDKRGQAYARMLFFQLWPRGGVEHAGFNSYEGGFAALHQQQAVRSELRQVLAHNLEKAERVPIPLTGIGDGRSVPLTIHSAYTREEMLSALGVARVGGPAPVNFAQGVVWSDSMKTDALFITLEKDDEPHFSPRSRLHDYALSKTLFQWESQSLTSETSPVGLRYRNHVEMGTSVLLFIRQYRRSDIGSAQPWVLLGPYRVRRTHGQQADGHPVEAEARTPCGRLVLRLRFLDLRRSPARTRLTSRPGALSELKELRDHQGGPAPVLGRGLGNRGRLGAAADRFSGVGPRGHSALGSVLRANMVTSVSGGSRSGTSSIRGRVTFRGRPAERVHVLDVVRPVAVPLTEYRQQCLRVERAGPDCEAEAARGAHRSHGEV